MGKQFYHFEPYSRVDSEAEAKKGRSIYSIVGEAVRDSKYSTHVVEPQKPELLFGVPFSEVEGLAEKYAENTFDTCGRAVRKNGFCLIAGVVSAPPDMTEKVWKLFKKASLLFLQETWGDNLKSVVEHTDEYFEPDEVFKIKQGILHRHLHFACVPPIGVNFAEIHAGIKAKRTADNARGMTKKPDDMCEKCFARFKKEGRIAGDRAYRNAMKNIQDDFFVKVGNPFGLLRYGPKRLRLSRTEIINRNIEKRLRQKQVVKLDEQEEKIKVQMTEIKENKKNLEELLSRKQNVENKLKDREKAVADREKIIREREKSVAFEEKRHTDFEKGLKTSLNGWQLPKPSFGESTVQYIKRIAGEVMGKVQRALNIIKENDEKKAELEKEKAFFEAEKIERQKQEADRIALFEKIYSEKLQKLKIAYENLKRKIIRVKTTQELVSLQGELSHKQQYSRG